MLPWHQTWWGRILLEHDTEPVELQGGWLKILIGFWLMLPMASFDSSPTFVALSILPEFGVGILLSILGVMHLQAIRNGRRNGRRVASTIGYFVWFILSAVFVWANYPAIGWLAFLTSGLSQLWCSLRLGDSS